MKRIKTSNRFEKDYALAASAEKPKVADNQDITLIPQNGGIKRGMGGLRRGVLSNPVFEHVVHAGLPSVTHCAEVFHHFWAIPHRKQNLSVAGFWPTTSYQLFSFVQICLFKEIICQFWEVFIFLRLDGVGVKLPQVAPCIF